METLEYERLRKQERVSTRRLIASFVLLCVAGLPIAQTFFVSAHGMTDWGHRIFKAEILVGFVSAFIVARLKCTGVFIFGLLLFVFYTLIVVAVAVQVVLVLAGRGP